MKRVIKVLAVSVLPLLTLHCAFGDADTESMPVLKVTLRALKQSHQIGDSAVLEVTIENIGKEALLLSSDVPGHIGRLITSPSGERLKWPDEPGPESRDRMLRLEPGCFCGARKEFGVNEAGAYRCRVVYVGAVSGIVPEMWKGRVESQEVTVTATVE